MSPDQTSTRSTAHGALQTPSSGGTDARTEPRDRPLYTAPKPALRFVNITNPKQAKEVGFKTDVRSQAMTSHMWSKRTQKNPRTMGRPPATKTAASQKTMKASSRLKIVPLDEDERQVSACEALLGRVVSTDASFHHDPFGLFPKVEGDVAVNIPALVHHGVRLFQTDHIDISLFWSQDLDPITIIPNLLLTSEHLDTFSGLTVDSKITAALRGKSLQLLNDHLQKPGSMDENLTILTVNKLLSSELMINGAAAPVHQRALQSIVKARGGLPLLRKKHPLIAPYVNSVVFYHYIIHELQPDREWFDFAPIKYRLATSITNENPLTAILDLDFSIYAPHMKRAKGMGFVGQLVEPTADPAELVEFLPIRQSKYFSKQAQELLLNLRNSINIFLGLDGEDDRPKSPGTSGVDRPEVRDALKAILLHTQLLPSAADSSESNPVRDDWLYECCRLTCLVVFTSTYLRIPFSQSNRLLAERYGSVLPTTAFAAALLRTDLANSWGENSAICVLFAIIQGAAASHITAESPPQDYRARKWIISTYMKGCVTLGFEPGWAFNGLLRILLDVQSKLGERYDV